MSAFLDDSSYEEGDNPVLTIEVQNIGTSIASNVDVLVTLPAELGFGTHQSVTSSPGGENSRIFHLGDLPQEESISFSVQLDVMVNVPEDITRNIDLLPKIRHFTKC